MTPVEYARPEAQQSLPILGRLAAICLAFGLVSFCVALCFRDHFNDKWNESILPLFFIVIFAIAFIVSIAAVARRRSRTKLAVASLVISTTLWAFYFAALFGGM
jgi:hypothetical protein